MRRNLGILLFVLIVVALLFVAFRTRPIDVDVAVVATSHLEVTVDEDGKSRIKEKYVVSSPLSGRLTRIVMNPGDPVHKGESLLATIQPQDPQLLDARELALSKARVSAQEAAVERSSADIERTRAALELAETELARARANMRNKSISRQELDQAETAYRLRSEDFRAARFSEEIARFELAQAKAAFLTTDVKKESDDGIDQFEIHAPISGRVLRLFQESSTVVAAGTPLIEIGDPVDLEIEIDVLSNDAVKITPGAAVRLEHWGGDQPLDGRVRVVEPAAFTKISALGVEEQRVNVIVDLVTPPEKRPTLGDGYRVEAQIVVWENDQIVTVPTSALFREGDKWAVFRLSEGVAKMTTISIGQQNGLNAQVLDGLSVGDQIVVHPSDKLMNGSKVAIRNRPR